MQNVFELNLFEKCSNIRINTINELIMFMLFLFAVPARLSFIY